MDENNLLTVYDGDETNEEGNRTYPLLPAGKYALFLDKGISPMLLTGIFLFIAHLFRGANLFQVAARADQWAKRFSS